MHVSNEDMLCILHICISVRACMHTHVYTYNASRVLLKIIMFLHTCMHTFIHAYMCTHTYAIHTMCCNAQLKMCMNDCLILQHTYMDTYMRTCMHAYVHTYTQYAQRCSTQNVHLWLPHIATYIHGYTLAYTQTHTHTHTCAAMLNSRCALWLPPIPTNGLPHMDVFDAHMKR